MSTKLLVPPDFPLAGLVPDVAEADQMFDGRSDHYLRVGLSALRIIEAAYHEAAPPKRILDIPSGHGRVTRVLRARFAEASIVVCDLDRGAVDYAAATFGAQGIYSSQDLRELDVGGSFDLIWVGSLLTHLPKLQAARFLDFATRHMHRNSRLIVTTHGAYVADRLRSYNYGLEDEAACALLAEYRMHGYGYRGYGGGAHYGISLTDRGWIEDLLAKGALALQSYQPRGWDRHQDALVLRLRQPGGRLGTLLRRSAPSFEQLLGETGAGHARADDGTVEGFDEAWYLARYPDVADAVRDGHQPSGLVHYRTYGWRERRDACDPARTFEFRPRPARRASLGVCGFRRDARVDEIWSQDPAEEAEENGQYWMAHPAVRARVNRLATGNEGKDAYDRLALLARERGLAVPIRDAVSLGCGFGALERDLYARGLCAQMDAYDLARRAIDEASRQAQALDMSGLRFRVADLESIKFRPRSVDIVIAHSAVHHVERLEALFDVVRRCLRPGGLFHLNEFVGPTRFQWSDRQIELSNQFLANLPERLRRLPSGKLKEDLRRPTIDEMIAADPTEAVRSAEIVEILERSFDIVEMRPLGGALLHLALGGIAQNFDAANAGDAAILSDLFATEDRAMEDGLIKSDFTVIVATPRQA
jgi:SAM-dependent methyltransferase